MIKRLIKGNKEKRIILILFILSTSFFIYQNATCLSWDFSSYVLNAKYWFDGGKYFEPLRPPAMPFILGLFSVFGWRASETIFVILTSFLFMYSTVRLAKDLNFNPIVFYAISLNAYLLSVGLINGTELLSLAFLELFLSFLIENKPISGLFLGLSSLSRYTGFAFFPLILLHLNIKKILKSLILFGATVSSWFIYNYYKFGNLFTSIADQYANNILYREYLIQPMQLSHFLQLQNILLPFFLIGVIIKIYRGFEQIKVLKRHKISLLEFLNKYKIELIILFLLFTSIFSYKNTPVKDVRYLFNLVLPTFYFSYIGLNYIVKKTKDDKRLLLFIAILIFIVSFFTASFLIQNNLCEPRGIYLDAINKLDELNLSECSIMSNAWVILNDLNRPSLPFPREELISRSIEEGQIIVLFKHVKEPPYVFDNYVMGSLPLIYEDEKFIILGTGKCLPITPFEESYLQQLDKIIFDLYAYHINTNPCFILFHNSPFLEKTCNFVNLNGFKQDEYRVLQ